MNKGIIAVAFFISLTAFCIIDKKDDPFKKLYGLQGVWKMTNRHGSTCEEWKKVNANYLQSRGYMIKNNNDTIISERVALTKKGSGIFYTSTVEEQNNKQPVAFKLTKATNNVFVFENPEHDFPKRIVYEFINADSLHAYIDDGTDKGKRQNFYYKKQ